MMTSFFSSLSRYLFVLLIGAVSLTSTIFAGELFDKISLPQRQAFILSQQENPFLSSEDRLRIHKNHSAYLCANKQLPLNDPACQAPVSLYQMSPYVMDHIIDYAWRSLDAMPASHYPGATMDAQGTLWREFITHEAIQTQGAIPRVILNSFEKTWFEGDVIPTRTSFACRDIQPLYESRDEIPLSEKYRAVCMISFCAARSLGLEPDKDHYQLCLDQAQQRTLQETAYVQTLMMQQANTMLNTQRETFINEYLFGRAQTLIEKISLWEVYMDHRNNKYIEGTDQCRAG